MCKCSPYLKETKSHEWDTSTLKLRRKRTNILTILLPYFFPKFTWFLIKNAQVKCISTLPFQACFFSLLTSQHFLSLCCEDSLWNMGYIPSKAHGLCTRLAMLATARHQVAKHVAVFGNLVLLAQIDVILSFETHLLQNWKCQYTSRE